MRAVRSENEKGLIEHSMNGQVYFENGNYFEKEEKRKVEKEGEKPGTLDNGVGGLISERFERDEPKNAVIGQVYFEISGYDYYFKEEENRKKKKEGEKPGTLGNGVGGLIDCERFEPIDEPKNAVNGQVYFESGNYFKEEVKRRMEKEGEKPETEHNGVDGLIDSERFEPIDEPKDAVNGQVYYESGGERRRKSAHELIELVDYSGSDEELNMDFKGFGIDEPRTEETLPEEVLADSGCRMLDGIYRIVYGCYRFAVAATAGFVVLAIAAAGFVVYYYGLERISAAVELRAWPWELREVPSLKYVPKKDIKHMMKRIRKAHLERI